MERQEPKFEKDMQDVEFRPRAYRGPSLPPPSRDNDGFAWKIGITVGIGVLAALLIFNAYERYQARRDAEQVLQALKQETAKLEREIRPPFALQLFLRLVPLPSSMPFHLATVVRAARWFTAMATAGPRLPRDPTTSTARLMEGRWTTVIQ